MIKNVLLTITVLAIAGCGGQSTESEEKKLTETQRDSVLSESPLPGSGVVGKAIDVADTAAARAKRLDKSMQ